MILLLEDMKKEDKMTKLNKEQSEKLLKAMIRTEKRKYLTKSEKEIIKNLKEIEKIEGIKSSHNATKKVR